MDLPAHYQQWNLTGHNWNSIYKVFVVYFHHSCPFYFHHSCTIKVSKYYFVFLSFILLHIILQFFKEMPPSQAFPGAIQRTLALEGVVLKNKNLPFGAVYTSVIPSRAGWSRTSSPFGWLERNNWGPINYFLWCIWSWLIWVSVEILMTLLEFLQNSSVTSYFKGSLMGSTYHAATIKKSEKKKFLILFHLLPCN